jgi:hypothetical protein
VSPCRIGSVVWERERSFQRETLINSFFQERLFVDYVFYLKSQRFDKDTYLIHDI